MLGQGSQPFPSALLVLEKGKDNSQGNGTWASVQLDGGLNPGLFIHE